MKFLLPVILAVLGVAGGLGVGVVMKPAPDPAEMAEGEIDIEAEAAAESPGDAEGSATADDSEYVSLESKMIAPFTRSDGRPAFVAAELTLEVAPGATDRARNHEPKIVSEFLRVLIGFAATGAFDDHTHAPHTLAELNAELNKSAEAVLGEDVRAVLIANLLTSDG